MNAKKKIILVFSLFFIISVFLNIWGILKYKNEILPKILELQKKERESSENLSSLSSLVVDYFRAVNEKCEQISPYQISALQQCITDVLQEIKSKPKLTKVSFKNYYPGNIGSLVFINVGKNPLDSENFQLYWNNVLQDSDGCKVKGKIKPQFPCELNFYQNCKKGDVLEVFYQGQSVAIITDFEEQ